LKKQKEEIMEENKKINQPVEDSRYADVKMLPIEEMKNWYRAMTQFGKDILRVNIDYGIVSGIGKPALLKPGAEKIKKAFGLQVERMDCVKEIIETEKNYLDYTYKCIITSKNGLRLGICDGNANSKEEKFRFIFKPSEKIPERKIIEKMKIEGTGKWKKYSDKWVWMERNENPDVLALKNCIQKVAQKRAFVGAILMATGASEFFTQDMTSNG
jgi:hypothetical protein